MLHSRVPQSATYGRPVLDASGDGRSAEVPRKPEESTLRALRSRHKPKLATARLSGHYLAPLFVAHSCTDYNTHRFSKRDRAQRVSLARSECDRVWIAFATTRRFESLVPRLDLREN